MHGSLHAKSCHKDGWQVIVRGNVQHGPSWSCVHQAFLCSGKCVVALWQSIGVMLQAVEWWINYFALSPVSTISCGGADRRVVHAWTDAAGASRWLAAVIRTEAGFFWTRSKLPDAWAVYSYTPSAASLASNRQL